MEEVYINLRKLAKSNKYQNLYNVAKELNVQMFQNNCDFSDLQMNFLHFVAFYSNLMTDYAMGEVDFLVFDNFIYEDAYHYYKVKKNRKELSKQKQAPDNNPRGPIKPGQKEEITYGQSSWVFKKR